MVGWPFAAPPTRRPPESPRDDGVRSSLPDALAGSSTSLVGAVATYRRVGAPGDSTPGAPSPSSAKASADGGGAPPPTASSPPTPPAPAPPPSRASAALRALLLVGAGAALLHGASCGPLYCGGASARSLARADVAALHSLRGAPPAPPLPRSRAATADPPHPALIPRVIHQTYRSAAAVPPAAAALMRTWADANPGWEVKFWDDDACLTFVQTEFPEYAPAYAALPKDVERADFFRYLVVLKHGGVYADVDTECRVPLDRLLRPDDALVVGWENEFPSAPAAARRKYVRKRQVLQWVFAGAPGHPALRAVCDHVARHARSTLASSSNFDTLERTGPGAFTDAVLAAADAHPPRGGGAGAGTGAAAAPPDPWSVRFLPKVVFGAHPRALDRVRPDDPRVAVLHHYLGTWKSVGGWAGGGVVGAAAAALRRGGAVAAPAPAAPGYEAALPHDRAAPRFYPVSLTTAPPVSVTVPLAGAGERVAGDDAAAGVTVYGAWAPGGPPPPGASPTDALLAALGAGDGGVLLDVGAGVGAASIAAASRGVRVVAAEAGPVLAAALRSSVAYNGLDRLVEVHEAAVGGREAGGDVCVGAAAAGGGRDRRRGDAARGYALPVVDDATAATPTLPRKAGPTAAAATPSLCNATAPRVPPLTLVPAGARVAAVRVSAPGWEAAILDGLDSLLTGPAPPRALLIEFDAAALDAATPAPPPASSSSSPSPPPPPPPPPHPPPYWPASPPPATPAPTPAPPAPRGGRRSRARCGSPPPPRRAGGGGGRAPASTGDDDAVDDDAAAAAAAAAEDDLAPPAWCALVGEADAIDMVAASKAAGVPETVLLLAAAPLHGGGGGGGGDGESEGDVAVLGAVDAP